MTVQDYFYDDHVYDSQALLDRVLAGKVAPPTGDFFKTQGANFKCYGLLSVEWNQGPNFEMLRGICK